VGVNMNFFKKLLISIFILCTVQVAHAEYILFKKAANSAGKTVMQPLTEAEHAQAYPLLMKYQFPMSLCHDLEKELSKEELALLDRNEEAFIRSKLPKGIEIAFIPTVIYELSAILHELNGQIQKVCVPAPIDDTANKISWIKQIHLVNNNQLIKLIASNQIGLDKKHVYLNFITQIVNNIIDVYQVNNNHDNIFLKKFISEPKNIEFFQHIALTEYQAHRRGLWLIWRCSKLIADSTFGKWKNTAHSLSFGNSVFAGFYFDKTACPFYYLTNYIGLDFYGVTINKRNYRLKELEYDLFYIPALTTLVGLFGWGEIFHARSKIFSFSNLISGFMGLKNEINKFLLTNQSHFTKPEQFELAYQLYLKKNIIFKQTYQQIKSKL